MHRGGENVVRNGQWVSQDLLVKLKSFHRLALFFFLPPIFTIILDLRYDIILPKNSILAPSINWIIPETNNILSHPLSKTRTS